MKCVLLETKDKRKFFTQEKNLSKLKYFVNIFEIEVKPVMLKKGKLLGLKELITTVCNPNVQKKEEIEYEEIKKQTKSKLPATKIKEFIYNQFYNNKSVSLSDLKKEFKNYNLSDSTFCNHRRKVKELLEKQGFKFKKISPGNYQKD